MLLPGGCAGLSTCGAAARSLFPYIDLLAALRRILSLLIPLLALTAFGWIVVQRVAQRGEAELGLSADQGPIPIEVGPIERGPITLRRTFSGALEASAQFVVAPKVGGRLQSLAVDLGDAVERGQVVATLDEDELVQAVHQDEADLTVARASLSAAKSALEIAERGLQRAQSLRGEGVTSDSQLDAAMAEQLAGRAEVEVRGANVERAQAALQAARIRLGYARVTADWSGDDERRVVAERFVDEGGMLAANAPLLTIVALDPLVGVILVPERDYAGLELGQTAQLTTDAHREQVFGARVARIAPVFQSATRQARIELQVENPDAALKPGMFVRATLELARVEQATTVPFEALVERAGRSGVFVLDQAGERVRWQPVTAGIREGARIEVRLEGEQESLVGRVVTLGQELLEDGSRVHVVLDEASAHSPPLDLGQREVPGESSALQVSR